MAEFKDDAVIRPIAQMYLAQIQAHVGEVDAAIAGVGHLLSVPRGLNPADLRYSPFWDPVRNDPRFQALMENPPAVRL